MSNEWNAFRSMNAGRGWSTKKMSREYRSSFGRSCPGLRKTINPKCEDEPGCVWYTNKGCRPGTAPPPRPPSQPQREMPIGNCARCAKTVKRRDCPGGVCGGNGLCHWCVGEGCREIGYACKRAAASATKQAKAHASREKRAKSAAEKEAARRAKEQAKAQAKQAREDAKRAKEQERRAKEADKKAKAAEAKAARDEEKRRKAEDKARKAEEKRRRDEKRHKEQYKKANACKENVQRKKVTRELDPSNTRNTHLAYLLENCPHSPSYGGTFEFKSSPYRSDFQFTDSIETYNTWREVWAAFIACNPGISIGDIDRAYITFVRALDHEKAIKEQYDYHPGPKEDGGDEKKCDRDEQQRILEQNPKCQGESIYCDTRKTNNPDVVYINELLNVSWGGSAGPMPKKLMPAAHALVDWSEVHALYLRCEASAEDVLKDMDKFNLLTDQVRFEMQERADRAKAKAPKPKAKAAPCNNLERYQELKHLDPLDRTEYPVLAEMAIVWPEKYHTLPKLKIEKIMDIRPHRDLYMALPSRRKVELFVAWMELANAFDDYVECRDPLSDFRQARRRFTSVEEEYNKHRDEEDVGAGGSAGGGSGEYAHHREKGVHCNKTELAKVRNYSQAIYNIWNDPRGLSKPKIIKLIRGSIPNADVKGLTKNQLVEWARQLFGVPGGEVRQEDGTRDAFEHHFAEYDLNEDRYLDELELIWAKCNNEMTTEYDGEFTRPAYDYNPDDYDSQGNYAPSGRPPTDGTWPFRTPEGGW